MAQTPNPQPPTPKKEVAKTLVGIVKSLPTHPPRSHFSSRSRCPPQPPQPVVPPRRYLGRCVRFISETLVLVLVLVLMCGGLLCPGLLLLLCLSVSVSSVFFQGLLPGSLQLPQRQRLRRQGTTRGMMIPPRGGRRRRDRLLLSSQPQWARLSLHQGRHGRGNLSWVWDFKQCRRRRPLHPRGKEVRLEQQTRKDLHAVVKTLKNLQRKLQPQQSCRRQLTLAP